MTGSEQQSTEATKKSSGPLWPWGLGLVVLFGLFVGFFALTGDPDNWKPCSERMNAAAPGGHTVDFDISSISWESQPDSPYGEDVEVARGTGNVAGEPFRFECGVSNGEVQWLDIS